MIQAGKVLRIVPDQAGKGGSKTALTTFETNLDSRKVHNLMVYLGRWRTVPMAQDYGLFPAPDSLKMYSLHNYLSYSTTEPASRGTSVILSHTVSQANPIYSQIFNHTKGFTLRASGVYADPHPCTPAVFVNIKNRCFICWGGSNNFIDSDPTLTSNDPAKIYDIGVNPPATPPTYLISGYVDYLDPALYNISYTTGSNKLNGYSANIVLNPPPIFSSSINSVRIGGTGGTVYQVQSYVDTFTTSGTVTAPGATNQLTVNGFHFPPNGDWNGLEISINAPNAEVVEISSYTYSGGNTVVTCTTSLAHAHTTATYSVIGEQLVLSAPVTETTVIATGQIRIFTGSLSWIGVGPTYSYGYYDPITGHVSNESPVVQVTERDMAGVDIQLLDMMSSPASDQDRFTQILPFRSLLAGGSGARFPIAMDFDPSTYQSEPNTGVSQNFFDDNPDSALLVNGGLQAPLVNNAKPPRFSHMAYWDQRLWGAPVNDPSAVLFSGDFIQIPFGVSEESFPSLNALRISSDDGRVTGLQLVGGDLVITTERYSYTVQGVGPQYYRLVRLGAAQFGVGDYQMAEFPGDTAATQSGLLYLGRDARLYLMAPGYGNVSVSDPVANQFQEQILNDDANYAMSRVQYFTAPNQRLALVSLPDNVQMYDFDRKVWIDTNPNIDVNDIARPQAFCTIYGGSRPVDLIYGNTGTVYSWMRNEDGQQGCVASELSFAAIDFGTKKRKQLNFIRIYTNAASPILFAIYPDETADPYFITATEEPDPLRSIYAPVADPVEVGARELVGFPLTPLTEGDMNTATVTFYRLKLNIFGPGDGIQYDYYAIDIGYSELEPIETTSI